MKITILKNGNLQIDGENNLTIDVSNRHSPYVFINGVATDWLLCDGIQNKKIEFTGCHFIGAESRAIAYNGYRYGK